MSDQSIQIDWNAIRQRLASSQAALERAWSRDDARVTSMWKERAQRLAQRVTLDSEKDQGIQALCFRLGPERYAFELARLTGVTRLDHCTKVPGNRPEMMGVIHVRGSIRPVADLARLLDIASDEASRPGFALLLRRGDAEVGLAVDVPEGVVNLEDAANSDDETTGHTGNALAKRRYPDGLVLLDADAVARHEVFEEV